MDAWEKVNAVQRMQDYIAAHLCQTITLGQLAAQAGYSPWYASRCFRELLGISPLDYIRSLRLSHAALRLRDTDARVLDIALDSSFESHEGFTRAFSGQFGLTPRGYRRDKPPVPLFIGYGVRARCLLNRKGDETVAETVKTVFVQVEERPERKLILMRGKKAEDYFAYCEEVGCDVWGVLLSIQPALFEPIGMWLPQSLIVAGTSQYAQGVEVPADYSGRIPQGMEIISLPACKMMFFQGQTYDDDNFMDEIVSVWRAIDAYTPELHGWRWAPEDGPRIQYAPMGERGYIEARPVKKI